jgi:SAM-dependent methyltransferase
MSPAGPSELAALRGEPSYVWRAGQARRLELVNRFAPLAGRRVLDVGCGLGTPALRAYTPAVFGTEIEHARARVAGAQRGRGGRRGNAALRDGSFDVVFSHEVIEHVGDDRLAAREMVRVLRPGGRLVVFCPNRGWPFEQHGIYWRGTYRFGNAFGVNWLPDAWRNRLAPHGAYTRRPGGAVAGAPVRVVAHRQRGAGAGQRHRAAGRAGAGGTRRAGRARRYAARVAGGDLTCWCWNAGKAGRRHGGLGGQGAGWRSRRSAA